MPQGTIKKLVKDRGFGFISTNSGKGDVFFHVSAVADGAFDALQEGQSVEFEIVEDGGGGRGKGPRGGNGRPASPASRLAATNGSKPPKRPTHRGFVGFVPFRLPPPPRKEYASLSYSFS